MSIRIGSKVRITRRNGQKANGKLVEVREGGRGAWFDVNVAAPRQPQDIVAVRACNLRPA